MSEPLNPQDQIQRLQRRITELLEANNREVERRRSAEFQAHKLTSLLNDYEAWEADLVLHADWSAETPRLTQRQLDRMMKLQAARNMALRPARLNSAAGRVAHG